MKLRLNDYQKYRILEILPGLVVWLTLITVFVLIFVKPLWMIYAAILFDLYWLLRVWYFSIYLSKSWIAYRNAARVDWMAKVREHTDWESYPHLVFLPTLDEDISIVRHTLQSITESSYPAKNIYIVLAGEERQKDTFEPMAAELQKEYADIFGGMLITVHPANIPGELAAKGSNLHWAGQRAQEWVDGMGWNYDKIITSAFDIDTIPHREYFACLTDTYLRHPHPTRSSYQPLAVYNNNVWESFSFARVVAASTTFWLMAELARPKPLWTFSSHAMSFRALVDVGFWQSDIVTEDSRIFLQCYLRYDGDYEVTPMYIPVSMDTAHGGTLWGTMKNLYKQMRRWAWGIENFPFMVWHFKNNKLTSKKWHILFNLVEGMHSWATAAILITALGYLPLWMLNPAEEATVVAQTAPFILEWLMRLALIGIIFSAVLNVYLLPREVPGNRWLRLLVMVLQWALLPIALIFFGAIPAIDAQTRMMLGKYLGFYTAKKVRKQTLPHHIDGGSGA